MLWSFVQPAVWQHCLPLSCCSLWERNCGKSSKCLIKPCALSKHVSVSVSLFLVAAAPINFAGMQTGACRKAFAGHDTSRTAVRMPWRRGGFAAVQKPPKNLDNAQTLAKQGERKERKIGEKIHTILFACCAFRIWHTVINFDTLLKCCSSKRDATHYHSLCRC